ncbi:MAG: hypothetical protein NC930_07410, partial [Candidatus Omnitrophica bacterium]|nr:hypothetical protein [Candidatus Omnitrophota bacterium]
MNNVGIPFVIFMLSFTVLPVVYAEENPIDPYMNTPYESQPGVPYQQAEAMLMQNPDLRLSYEERVQVETMLGQVDKTEIEIQEASKGVREILLSNPPVSVRIEPSATRRLYADAQIRSKGPPAVITPVTTEPSPVTSSTGQAESHQTSQEEGPTERIVPVTDEPLSVPPSTGQAEPPRTSQGEGPTELITPATAKSSPEPAKSEPGYTPSRIPPVKKSFLAPTPVVLDEAKKNSYLCNLIFGDVLGDQVTKDRFRRMAVSPLEFVLSSLGLDMNGIYGFFRSMLRQGIEPKNFLNLDK